MCLVVLTTKDVYGPATPASGPGIVRLQTLRCLSNGFIVTSLLWAAALAKLLDGRPLASAAYFAVAGVCALFGVIHSPLPNEQIGLPADVLAQLAQEAEPFVTAAQSQTPYHWTAAYGVAAALLAGLALVRPAGENDIKGQGDEARRSSGITEM